MSTPSPPPTPPSPSTPPSPITPPSPPSPITPPSPSSDTDFLSNILTPGSSLHPTFLLILDIAFVALLLVFITAAILTGGNLHIFALIAIELCLWASVKWYVNELKTLEREQNAGKQAAEGIEETKKTK